jgi:hypothetical protein
MTNLLDAYLLFRIRVQHDPEVCRLYDRYIKSIYRFIVLKSLKEQAEDTLSRLFARLAYLGK